MARSVDRLSARTVQTLTKPGRHADGGGLYLVVDASGAKRWVFLFRDGGRLREMGLGGLSAVSLADARLAAEAARKAKQAGRDPITARDDASGAAIPTFGKVADDLIASISEGFRNAKHIAQWETTLSTYAKPLRQKRVDMVTTEDVLAILAPLWSTKQETASRLRGRIERVLNAAKAKGYRTGENPATWRGHLANLMPKRTKLARGHHAALPYVDLPAFLQALAKRPALAARALEFTILTAARSGETLGARWREIDQKEWIWTVPAERMKAGREHRVPLSPSARALLERLAAAGVSAPDAYVFPGNKKDRPLSVMAMEMVLRRMKSPVTVHGFRSAFRDWCYEETDFAREIAEAALAHVVGDATERAYRRGDALKKRRALMEAWAVFCAEPPKKLVEQSATEIDILA